MKDAPDTIQRPRRIRTFEITTTVSGYTPGPMSEWPSEMQDAIYQALDRKAKQVQLPLAVVASEIKKDHGAALDGSQDRWFAHVIASEVVARDMRMKSDADLERAVLEGFEDSKQ